MRPAVGGPDLNKALHRKPEFAGRVVGFANWEVHPHILNTQCSGIPVGSGFDTGFPNAPGSRLELVQQLQKDTIQVWYDRSFYLFLFHAANEYIRAKQPRLVWLAVIGPDTRPLGERTNTTQVTHSQIAASLAALLGEDYHAAVPSSGAPIQDLLPAVVTKP